MNPSQEINLLDMEKMLNIFGISIPEVPEFSDFFKFFLLDKFGDTHLPELYEAIGRDSFLRVLDIFQGTELISCKECGSVIYWPSKKSLFNLVRDLVIYFKLKRAPIGRKADLVSSMSEEFGISKHGVRLINRNTKRIADKMVIV